MRSTAVRPCSTTGPDALVSGRDDGMAGEPGSFLTWIEGGGPLRVLQQTNVSCIGSSRSDVVARLTSLVIPCHLNSASLLRRCFQQSWATHYFVLALPQAQYAQRSEEPTQRWQSRQTGVAKRDARHCAQESSSQVQRRWRSTLFASSRCKRCVDTQLSGVPLPRRRSQISGPCRCLEETASRGESSTNVRLPETQRRYE